MCAGTDVSSPTVFLVTRGRLLAATGDLTRAAAAGCRCGGRG